MKKILLDFKELVQRLNYQSEIEIIYKRLIERLNERETATALCDKEYDALDEFATKLDSAMERIKRSHVRKASLDLNVDSQDNTGQPLVQRAVDMTHPRTAATLHLLFMERFSEVLPALGISISLLGDGLMHANFQKLHERAERNTLLVSRRLHPRVKIADNF